MKEFIKYPRIERTEKATFDVANTKFNVYEKYDGANGRCYITSDLKLIFGSRNSIFVDDEQWTKRFRPAFEEFIDKSREIINNFKNKIVFFEIMIKHTLSYNWENTPKLIILDVFNRTNGEFEDIETHRALFENQGFHVAKLCGTSKLNEFEFINSEFGPFLVEGYVYKNYKLGKVYKQVRQEFKELNSKVFGKPKKEMDDSEKIAEYIAPKARIDKIIYKVKNEKNIEVGLPMMKYVPRMVIDDALEEITIKEIFNMKININTVNIKKHIIKNVKRRIMYLETLE